MGGRANVVWCRRVWSRYGRYRSIQKRALCPLHWDGRTSTIIAHVGHHRSHRNLNPIRLITFTFNPSQQHPRPSPNRRSRTKHRTHPRPSLQPLRTRSGDHHITRRPEDPDALHLEIRIIIRTPIANYIIIITHPRTSLRKHARRARKVSTKRDIENQALRAEERAHAAVGRGVVHGRCAEDARVDGGRVCGDIEGGGDVGPGEEPDIDCGVGEFGDELAAACAGEGGAVRVCRGIFDDATFVGVGLVGAVGRVDQRRSLVGAGDGTALRRSEKRVRPK